MIDRPLYIEKIMGVYRYTVCENTYWYSRVWEVNNT